MARVFRSFKRYAGRSPVVRRAYFRFRDTKHRIGIRMLSSRLRGGREASARLDPTRIVWIFCTSRSGSTWLKAIMADILPSKVWEEPKVGRLFGGFYDSAQKGQLASASFVMGNPNRPVWIGAVRNFVLATAEAAHPSIASDEFLIIKEPDGAIGAEILMEAIPESRMILLVRDPRDVAASALDGVKTGNWMYEAQDENMKAKLAKRDTDGHVRSRAVAYGKQIGNAREALENHGGLGCIVRYEDLRADTPAAIERAFRELGLPFDTRDIARAVEKYSWENVPEDQKGEGKFYRKARPGSWREDLSPEQIRQVEEATAPLLEEFYPG